MPADGFDRGLQAITSGVDPHWLLRADGRRSWIVQRGDVPAKELPEVTVTKFSTGMAFGFER